MAVKSNSVQFDAFFAELKTTILNEYGGDESIRKVMQHVEKVIDYNVPHGKKLRGLCTYESYLLLPDRDQSNEKKALALGWCIELLQASFLVADDIMDNSKTRRGQPCWYLNGGIGNNAINDGYYLLSCVYIVIRKYLADHKLYSKFYELFSEVFMQTTIGQSLDLLVGSQEQKSELFDFTNYTEQTYNTIVKWKTAFYSFVLPVACALYLANIDDKSTHSQCKEILLQMGHYFQVQDDYLDCYGDPKVTGKIGTDIEESKCGWLLVQALNRSNEAQKMILKQNYGKTNEENVKKVKQLYNELHLSDVYKAYELKEYESISKKISNSDPRVKQLLELYVKKIFKRSA